jgi:phage antirepressor YoqD-like protein
MANSRANAANRIDIQRTKLYTGNETCRIIMELGLFELKKTSITKPDGSVFVTVTAKVTGKGQIYFINRFITEKAA